MKIKVHEKLEGNYRCPKCGHDMYGLSANEFFEYVIDCEECLNKETYRNWVLRMKKESREAKKAQEVAQVWANASFAAWHEAAEAYVKNKKDKEEE